MFKLTNYMFKFKICQTEVNCWLLQRDVLSLSHNINPALSYLINNLITGENIILYSIIKMLMYIAHLFNLRVEIEIQR